MIRLVAILCMWATPVVAQVWPTRVGDQVSFVYEYPPAAGWFGVTLSPRTSGEAFNDADAIGAFVDHVGIENHELQFEQRSACIAVVRPVRRGERDDGYRYVVAVSASKLESGRSRLHRTWFRFRSPERPQGTAVLMPGMLGTPHRFVDRFERQLLENGWAVVRMLVPPSRTTEFLEVTLDPSDPADAIRHLAEELDERTAEGVFAVTGALEWVRSVDSNLDARPRVLIGMSGTGMMLPAILAGSERPFTAAVVIGSGANAFRILRDSSYATVLDSLRIRWETEPPCRSVLEKLDRIYLENAQLDAYVLGPRVRETPMLVVHGATDRAVPAAAGDLLWERLGKPERWSTPIGHELLFARAFLQIPQMIDWIGRVVAEDVK